MNPPPEDPAPPLSTQIQMIEDKLKLMEGENEDLHAKLNARTKEVASLQNAITVLRTHDTIDPAATVQLVDFWRLKLATPGDDLDGVMVAVEDQMTAFVQETAKLLQDQIKPRPGVQCYLDEKAHQLHRKLLVIIEQLYDWARTGNYCETDLITVADDMSRDIGIEPEVVE